MQKIRKIALVALLSILIVGIAYSVVKYTQQVSNTANIMGYEIQLWNKGTSSSITAIPWGDLEKGTSKTTETIFGTGNMTLKNSGDYNCIFTWNIDPSTPLPSGTTVKLEQDNGGWDEIFEGVAGNIAVPKGVYIYNMRFTLTIAADALRGPLTFKIELKAHDVL